jgi:hypothetical protein
MTCKRIISYTLDELLAQDAMAKAKVREARKTLDQLLAEAAEADRHVRENEVA